MTEAPLNFGPWAGDLTPAERRARCEVLRALCLCIIPAAVDLRVALRQAVTAKPSIEPGNCSSNCPRCRGAGCSRIIWQ